jgi:hypothetical protein
VGKLIDELVGWVLQLAKPKRAAANEAASAVRCEDIEFSVVV